MWEIANAKSLFVIEDADHAIGSSWKDREGVWHKVGSCSHSHLTIFSFHPVKTLTTGEGGMILTNNKNIADKCRLLRNHGITRDPSKFLNLQSSIFNFKSPPPWYYEMHELGYNYRITDFQCAMGLVQMQRLDEFVSKRREIWKYYNNKLSGIDGFQTPVEREGVRSAWHLYVAQVKRRDELLAYLHKNGIGAHAMYIPVHLQPYYQKNYGYQKGDFPKAEAYFDKCLVLPMYPAMTDDDVEKVIQEVEKFCL